MAKLDLTRITADIKSSIFPLTMEKFVRLLLIALALWAVVYNLKLLYPMGISILSGHYYAIFVGMVLILVFLIYPVSKNTPPRRWFDYILAIIGGLVAFNFGYIYRDVVITGGAVAGTKEFVLGIIGILVVLEAVRRTTGLAMVIVAAFFLVHTFYANHFPPFLRGPSVSFERGIRIIYLSSSGMIGFIMRIASTFIIAFATFGGIMLLTGAGERFTNMALSLVGHLKGGPAKMAVVASALLGTMTGDPIANVGISGSFSIPLMKKMKMTPEFAAAVETTASCGGLIMPPMMGAIIFIMVEITGIPYADIAIALIVPAILYFLAIYFQIGFHTSRRGITGLPKAELPNWKRSLWEAKFLFLVFAFLIYLLMVARFFPVVAAYYSCGLMLVLYVIDRRSEISVKKFFKAIFDSLDFASRAVIRITPIIAAAGIILASLSLTGTGIRLSSRILEFAGDSFFLLVLLTGVITYVLCMGVSAMLTYVLLATIAAPAMVQFGVPIIAAHLFIIYVGLSGFFTPPYAVVALTASGLAGSNFYKTCWQSMKLAVVAYLVPISIVMDPVLLLHNATPASFIIRVAICLVAVYFLSSGLEGYFHRRSLSWIERSLFSIGGMVLFVPYTQLDIIGGTLLITGLIFYFVKNRLQKSLVQP